jgi:hypothetical protein
LGLNRETCPRLDVGEARNEKGRPDAAHNQRSSGSTVIVGYTSSSSIAAGESVALHVITDADNIEIDVNYEGGFSRTFARIRGVRGMYLETPPDAYARGCGWPVTYELKTDVDWPSGPYRIRLTAPPRREGCINNSNQYDILLIVRASRAASTSRILMVLCTNTYQAYNNWGGHSLYAYNSIDGLPAHVLSFDRPGVGYHGDSTIETWEMPFVRWAVANGITLEYATNYDLEAQPDLISAYRLVLSVGHDEYWSAPMRDTLESFVDGGGNAAFLGGNSVCWRVKFEESGSLMRCHKDSVEDDPMYLGGNHRSLTTRWSDPLLERPENLLTGVCWNSGGYHRSHGMVMEGSGGFTVCRPNHWVFDGVGVRKGDLIGAEATVVGYETDGCLFRLDEHGEPVPTGDDNTPLDFIILAQAPAARYVGHHGMATMGIHRRGLGSVFTAGTTDWSHGLSSDPMVQRITLNVLARLS